MAEVAYFDSFALFVSDSQATFSSEFKRLAELRGWDKGSKTWRKHWARAVHAEFLRAYGTNTSTLEAWQALCEQVGLPPLPSISKCKQVLHSSPL